MSPSSQWLAQLAQKQHLLRPPVDLNRYFDPAFTTIGTQNLTRISLGPVSLPTGQVLVRDPLVYLRRDEQPYYLHVPPGEYDTEACVVMPTAEDCARYAAVRVRFTPELAVRFEEALIGHENLTDDLEAGDFFGFNVDSGLACIADTASRDAFCDFSEHWYRQHPNGNLYDDYFAALFRQSYLDAPAYQRRDGDWLNWQIPGTRYHITMFQSGFGDGCYPVYFGFDRQNQLCQLVIEFIDVAATYVDDVD
ncbi:DUF4241 domain-containing protein [Paralysiella testudinis]|uniref:DUF4241 domain-containing protein n=1 Tax=Paralysiella testudinis TaxID=2809020 RepID=A0A892ZD88_9NEIS|nr:DUF4241 domain-containing protein [Paralysiella testudinis]QRQ81011.1 DUF4241 domain-containing protein [Paralysiella testudinis]